MNGENYKECQITTLFAMQVLFLSQKVRKSEDRRFARFSDLPVWYFSDALQ